MLFDIEHELGVKGTASWILAAEEFHEVVDLVYKPHFGEIWLYNNSLEIILDSKDKVFPILYLEKISDTLKNNIDAVKILVSKKCERHVFPDAGGPSPELIQRLKQIRERGGLRRLKTIYFGRVSEARSKSEKLRLIPKEHTWVFYTHRSNLFSPNYGIVLVRPSEFPFYSKGRTPDRYAVAWQMTEDHLLDKKTQKAIMDCFEDKFLFWYFKGLSDPSKQLVNKWSQVTRTLKKRRDKTHLLTDTLAFGEDAGIAILSSSPDEITHLKELVGEQKVKLVSAPPTGRVQYECFAIKTKTLGTQKVLLANIDEGNLSAAGETWDLLSRYSPKYVILCGVAGADPNAEKRVQIGDVVVGEQVIDYEHGTIRKNKDGWDFKARGQGGWKPDKYLLKVAADLCEKWPPRGVNFGKRPKGIIRRPKARKSVLGSGSKIVEAPIYFPDMVMKANIKIDTVETEAAGVCQACHSHPFNPGRLLVVRGIMDTSDAKSRKKRETYRPYARKTCARFIFDLLRNL